jgi:hypothetical protein
MGPEYMYPACGAIRALGRAGGIDGTARAAQSAMALRRAGPPEG